MGGLIGYQLKSLQLITAAKASAAITAATAAGARHSSDGSNGTAVEDEQAHVTYHIPPGVDLAGEAGSETGVKAAAQGLLSLPYLSTILPVGGAGDRLGLRWVRLIVWGGWGGGINRGRMLRGHAQWHYNCSFGQTDLSLPSMSSWCCAMASRLLYMIVCPCAAAVLQV